VLSAELGGVTVGGRFTYPKGIRVSGEDMAGLNIHRNPFHGEWNYTIRSQKPKNDAIILRRIL
jgi:hypothetical protein